MKNTFNGLFGLLFVIICALVVWAQPQTAQAATKSTAQGVRKTTSSPAKKSVGKAKPVALPPEKAADATSKDIAAKATTLVGSRYVWGSANPKQGFDCSGLVQYVYAAKGKRVPRTTQALYQTLSKPKDLQVGDVIFFGRGLAVRHVAIYVGNGEIIHASTPSRGVLKEKVQPVATAMGILGVGRA